MTDGALRSLFSSHLREAHWVPVETWSTRSGVPDVEYCFPGGASGWIENKLTAANAVTFQPGQVGWLERRVRTGGRAYLAVRKKATGGPRRGASVDALYIYDASKVRKVALGGLSAAIPLLRTDGGPARWDWDAVRAVLTR